MAKNINDLYNLFTPDTNKVDDDFPYVSGGSGTTFPASDPNYDPLDSLDGMLPNTDPYYDPNEPIGLFPETVKPLDTDSTIALNDNNVEDPYNYLDPSISVSNVNIPDFKPDDPYYNVGNYDPITSDPLADTSQQVPQTLKSSFNYLYLLPLLLLIK